MYVGRDFDVADPGETEPFCFDFRRLLAAGETITSTSWTCSAIEGSDPDAASRLSGAAQVSGTKSLQKIGGLLAGVRYLLTATITTNQGNVKITYSHVTCEAGPS